MAVIYILSIILFMSLAMVAFLIIRLLESKKEDTGVLMLQQQISQITEQLNQAKSELARGLEAQFSASTGIIKEVTERLVRLDETNKQVISFSEQLGNLEKVLLSQKQRGNLGEAGLALVLENILPPTAYSLQYHFPDGETVDAAIFAKDGIIPVDAKFSLENYNRLVGEKDEEKKIALEKDFKNDLKKRIEETSKYIKPEQGTLGFAFMFIPAEAIYYDLLVNEVGAVKVNTRSLIEYAFREKKVIIVSPTTFAAYLLTVLQGLNALKIEEQTKIIIKRAMDFERHLLAFDDYLKKLGANIKTLVNSYNLAYKEYGKIDKDIIKISGSERDQIEIQKIEAPEE